MLALLALASTTGCDPLDMLDESGGEAHAWLDEDKDDDQPAADQSGRLRLQRSLDNLVAVGAPGAIALSRVGDELSVATSGVRSLETGARIRPTDRFRAGSTSKTITATVILQLVGEGRLSLDDTLAHWLPGIIPRGAEITIRQLLNHGSGIANNAHDPDMLAPYMSGDREHYWSPHELVALSARRPLAFEPGKGFLYSNTNYHLLGLIIQKVTGCDPLKEVERRVLARLDLHDSYFADRSVKIRGSHSRGYHFGPEFPGGDDTTVLSPSWAWTAGSLVTTVRDLAAFYRALFAGELLREAQMRELLTTVVGDEGNYGLGVSEWQTPCGPGWGHEGDVPGYHTFAINSLDGERQAIVFMNSDDAVGIGVADPDLSRAVFAAFCPDIGR